MLISVQILYVLWVLTASMLAAPGVMESVFYAVYQLALDSSLIKFRIDSTYRLASIEPSSAPHSALQVSVYERLSKDTSLVGPTLGSGVEMFIVSGTFALAAMVLVYVLSHIRGSHAGTRLINTQVCQGNLSGVEYDTCLRSRVDFWCPGNAVGPRHNLPNRR